MFYFKKIPDFIQGLFPTITWRVPNTDSEIFLTLDDGPHPDSTPIILDLLDQFRIKATFFCLGAQVEKHPELLQEIINRGHGIGSHGFRHISGWKTPGKSYIDQVAKATKLIPSDLFRPPFGRIKIIQYLKLRKVYRIVMWTLMPGDFEKGQNSQPLIHVTRKNLKSGDIIVLHDQPETIQKLQIYIPELAAILEEKNLKSEVLK